VNTNQGEGVAVRGRNAWLTHWVSDLRLGVRLAIGGGRTSKTGVVRLVLSTIGIGVAVAVLLIAASAGPMFNARSARDAAQYPTHEPVAGVDPLYTELTTSEFRGRPIGGTYLRASGPNAPLPPGVSRLPGDGEILLSPALADLLAGPDGEQLRPRFPQRVIGTIDPFGVVDAKALLFYAGDSSIKEDGSPKVYGYGYGGSSPPMPAGISVLIAIGSVVLLVPVFVFVGTSARIAGAERDRRLAALRLVGADARQTRRIAAAESLASAGTGLILGIGLFLLFRSLVTNFPILGLAAYPSDVTPAWPLVVVILLAVPLLSVLTAQVALRRTIIEPLGVVRRGKTTKRRLWWRLIPLVVGPAVLWSQADVSSGKETWLPMVVTGAALLLLGIPAILPWLLERIAMRLRGGGPAAQLAIRRLQLDSGTPARVVAGVSVVLAGAIALQAVLSSQVARYEPYTSALNEVEPAAFVQLDADATASAPAALQKTPGVREVVTVHNFTIRNGAETRSVSLGIASCDQLSRYTNVGSCADGDVFRWGRTELVPGEAITLTGMDKYYNATRETGSPWRLPNTFRELDFAGAGFLYGDLIVTPGALRGVTLPKSRSMAAVLVDSNQPDALEHMRNTLAPYAWRADVSTAYSYVFSRPEVQLLNTVRNALLGGALFTLLLAGVSMLVLALEQVRERRRALAALAATGVPTGTLARSLLWQNTVPVLLAVVVAVATGIGLAGLVFQLVDQPFYMDWLSVAIFSGIAAVLVLAVTALTLPTLRSATRLTALRIE
jgi:hypothetical protein